MNMAVASVDEGPSVESGNRAIAMIDEGNALEEQGRIAEAMARYDVAVELDPRCARAHLNRGNILLARGQVAEARGAYHLAISWDPHYAAAHFNLGNVDYRAGEFADAVRNYQVAIGIRPDFADAFVAMAHALDDLGRTDEAVDAYQRALAIAPESTEILSALATRLLSLGRSAEVLPQIARALEREPTWTNKLAFATCVAHARFISNDLQVSAALTVAISEAWRAPRELSAAAHSLIMLNRTIADCVQRANGAWPARLPKVTLFGSDGLAACAADHLLLALLEATPVPALKFERFLTCARHALLETATAGQAPTPSDVAALRFYAALARQCFINEYVFDCDDTERLAATNCRAKLLALLDAGAVVPPFLLLTVAAYFPLYTLRDSSRLLAANAPGPIDEVLRQQVREPLEQQALRAGIHCLTEITSGVSEDVRNQYEENPYPRWVKLPTCEQPLRFNDELVRVLPFAPFTPMPDDSAPEVLVAGCGTGAHAIQVARQYRGVRVQAIDLSLSSLAYAKRKTRELGITNIEYARADILKLGDLARTFDIIESGGVLHHLDDPFKGWRILLSLLRPGGFMRLGLYSEIARRHVVRAREIIAARGYANTSDDIRRFRQALAAQAVNAELQWIANATDFYSTSECRDLLFHVQEHRLTLDQIASFLAESALHFIGFTLDPGVLHQYRARFTDDPSATNLSNWARFELDNPDTFAGMYQFWIQKPISR